MIENAEGKFRKKRTEAILTNSPLDKEEPVFISSETKPESERIVLPTKLQPVDTPKFQEISFGYPTLLDGQARFWNMLVSTVAESGYKPPTDRQTQALNIGCGSCREGSVVNSFFGGEKFNELSERVHLTGIDKRKFDIEWAREDHQAPNFTFLQGDATKLDVYPQIPAEIDVAVFRHQHSVGLNDVWAKMFDQALQRLTPEGIIILTSFTKYEDDIALKTFSQLSTKSNVVISKKNPYAFPRVSSDIRYDIDGYISILKKA